MNRRLVLAAQCIVSAALIIWLFRGLDVHEFLALFGRLPGWFYVVSLAVILGGQVLYAWRWGRLLHASGVHVGPKDVLRHYFVGLFANNFMPGTIGGDVVKVYYIGREHGYRGVTASVVVDRILGVGVLAAVGALAGWMLPAGGTRLADARLALTLVAAVAAGLLGAAMVGAGSLTAWLERFGPRATAFAARVQRFRRAMAASLTKPVVFAQATFVVVVYFIALTMVYEWFVELNALPRPPFIAMFAAVASAAVLSNIPVALNGIGIREQLHVWLLASLGVPRTTAMAISLLLYGHSLIASLFGLVGWLRAPALPADFSDQVDL